MASDPAPVGDPQTQGVVQSQRVRVGMLGLASVFLLVMLATAIFSLGRSDRDSPSVANAIANAGDVPREPLAELGVAPGNPPETAPAAKPSKR